MPDEPVTTIPSRLKQRTNGSLQLFQGTIFEGIPLILKNGLVLFALCYLLCGKRHFGRRGADGSRTAKGDVPCCCSSGARLCGWSASERLCSSSPNCVHTRTARWNDDVTQRNADVEAARMIRDNLHFEPWRDRICILGGRL